MSDWNTDVSDLGDMLVKRWQELTQREQGTRLVVEAISTITETMATCVLQIQKKKWWKGSDFLQEWVILTYKEAYDFLYLYIYLCTQMVLLFFYNLYLVARQNLKVYPIRIRIISILTILMEMMMSIIYFYLLKDTPFHSSLWIQSISIVRCLYLPLQVY